MPPYRAPDMLIVNPKGRGALTLVLDRLRFRHQLMQKRGSPVGGLDTNPGGAVIDVLVSY
jgi:hypothetical protein